MTSEASTQAGAEEAPAQRIERERAATSEQHHVSAEESAAMAVNVTMTQEEIEAARAEQAAPPETTGGSINPPAEPVSTPFMTAPVVTNPNQVTGGWTAPPPDFPEAHSGTSESAPPPPPADPLTLQPGSDYIGAMQQAGELGPMTTTSPSMEQMQAEAAATEAAAEAEAEADPAPQAQSAPKVEATEPPKEQGAPPAGAEPSSSF